MDADECRELALLYREVAEEVAENEREGFLAIADELDGIADDEDGLPTRTIH